MGASLMQERRIKNMKGINIAAMMAVLVLLSVHPAHARVMKMVFWYPGEAGSTSEAQPVLGEFFTYLNRKISPDTVAGRYFNTTAEGLAYIEKERPAIGIISFAVWTENRDKLKGASVFLSTLPTPYGKSTENYALAGNDDKVSAVTEIFSSEPFSIGFVRNNLFASLPPDFKLTQTRQMLFVLKKIAEDQLPSKAILTPSEALSLSKLSATWAKSLKILAQSKPVPTARVVLFETGKADAARLKAALLDSGADPEAKETLAELRLMGFAEE